MTTATYADLVLAEVEAHRGIRPADLGRALGRSSVWIAKRLHTLRRQERVTPKHVAVLIDPPDLPMTGPSSQRIARRLCVGWWRIAELARCASMTPCAVRHVIQSAALRERVIVGEVYALDGRGTLTLADGREIPCGSVAWSSGVRP